MALPDEQTTTVGSVQRPWTKKKTSLKTLPQAQHGPGEASAEALPALSRLSDNRDDSERLLASDGYPIGGLAKIHEICVATGISKSKIFDLIDTVNCRPVVSEEPSESPGLKFSPCSSKTTNGMADRSARCVV